MQVSHAARGALHPISLLPENSRSRDRLHALRPMEDLHLPPSWVTDTPGWPTGRGVRVGIVNSGFDRALRDQRVLPGVSFVDPRDDFALLQSADDGDRLGSGTGCADLVLRIAPEA